MLQLENLLIQNQIDLLRNKENTMPVPVIAAGAAAVAARLAAKKVAQEVAKKAAKTVAAKTTQIAKNSVKVKPAAKPKPNKPDAAKTQFKNDSSRTRASDRAMKEYEKNVIRHGERPTDPSFGSKLGERAALNTKLKRKPNLPSKPAAIKKDATKENFYERIRNPIKINTNPTKPKGVFGPLKKKLAAADTPANRAKATNNARGLKAANKPVSKNNRNRFGDGEMPAYLKSIRQDNNGINNRTSNSKS